MGRDKAGLLMRRIICLFALAFSAQVFAIADPRCGVDAFGNAVCIDKDGVVTPAPKESGSERTGSSARGDSTSTESGDRSGRDDKNYRIRCGIDPFGNKVCR
ncbi:MAG: hypothetical protein A2Z95_10040 [Gallionellales bacterium GWA2_60_18]|nr:MAG: hypothetical protein A2Z95_10040 [Gallionellales bacterium GWA2_60_18]